MSAGSSVSTRRAKFLECKHLLFGQISKLCKYSKKCFRNSIKRLMHEISYFEGVVSVLNVLDSRT